MYFCIYGPGHRYLECCLEFEGDDALVLYANYSVIAEIPLEKKL